MVDSSKGHGGAISTESIVQDDLYFKNMLSLVHQHSVGSEISGEDDDDTTPSKIASPQTEEPLKNKKQKKQKKKKLKKEHTTENGDADAGEFTDLKPKKSKQENTESVPVTTGTTQPVGKPTKGSTTPEKGAKPVGKPTNGSMPPEKGAKPVGKPTNGSTPTEKGAKPIGKAANGSTAPEKGDSFLLSSIAELDDKRAKLRAKIEELRAKRQPNDRDRLERKKMMRRESKMKLKLKRKMEKMKKNKPMVNGDHAPKGSNSGGQTTPRKPILNSEGQIVFSKFDFTASGKKAKKEKSDLTGKDYKRLLEKIEKRNEKINKVKSKDENAGKSLEDKFKWQSAMHKAEGVKVKDNPELIKKALKRKEKIKEHKKKKWDARVETVKKLQNEKIKKRTDNINKRKQANKDKKMQKAKKKGRLLPGF